MLGKILLTAAVVCIAFFIIRQRHLAEHPGDQSRRDKTRKTAPPAASDDPGLSRDLRVGAYLFLILMVGLAGVMYYVQWQDDHTVITITLHRDNAQQPVTYQVYKYQLGERSFTTVNGVAVTVAASERMEIEGLGN